MACKQVESGAVLVETEQETLKRYADFAIEAGTLVAVAKYILKYVDTKDTFGSLEARKGILKDVEASLDSLVRAKKKLEECIMFIECEEKE